MSSNKGKITVQSTASNKRQNPYKDDVIYSPEGQWKYPGHVTKIPSGDITMNDVAYPVYGVDNLGNAKMMHPNGYYHFPGDNVTEYPMAYGGPTNINQMKNMFSRQEGGTPYNRSLYPLKNKQDSVGYEAGYNRGLDKDQASLNLREHMSDPATAGYIEGIYDKSKQNKNRLNLTNRQVIDYGNKGVDFNEYDSMSKYDQDRIDNMRKYLKQPSLDYKQTGGVPDAYDAATANIKGPGMKYNPQDSANWAAQFHKKYQTNKYNFEIDKSGENVYRVNKTNPNNRIMMDPDQINAFDKMLILHQPGTVDKRRSEKGTAAGQKVKRWGGTDAPMNDHYSTPSFMAYGGMPTYPVGGVADIPENLAFNTGAAPTAQTMNTAGYQAGPSTGEWQNPSGDYRFVKEIPHTTNINKGRTPTPGYKSPAPGTSMGTGYNVNTPGQPSNYVGVRPARSNQNIFQKIKYGVQDTFGIQTHETGGSTGLMDPEKNPFEDERNNFLTWLKTTSMDALHKDMIPHAIFHHMPDGSIASQAELEGNPDNAPINKKGGEKKNWIKGAVNPAHKGYCTPMTKSTCTPRRKAFAMTMKKHHGFHQMGGGSLGQGDPSQGTRPTSTSRPFMQAGGFYNPDMEYPYGGDISVPNLYPPNQMDMGGEDQFNDDALHYAFGGEKRWEQTGLMDWRQTGGGMNAGPQMDWGYNPNQANVSNYQNAFNDASVKNNLGTAFNNFANAGEHAVDNQDISYQMRMAQTGGDNNPKVTYVRPGRQRGISDFIPINKRNHWEFNVQTEQPVNREATSKMQAPVNAAPQKTMNKGRRSDPYLDQKPIYDISKEEADKLMRATDPNYDQYYSHTAPGYNMQWYPPMRQWGGGSETSIPGAGNNFGNSSFSGGNYMDQYNQANPNTPQIDPVAQYKKENPQFQMSPDYEKKNQKLTIDRKSQYNKEDLANWGIAGMEGLTSMFNQSDVRKKEQDLKNRTHADMAFTAMPQNARSRGDYDTNTGSFRPDQMVPVQFEGAPGFRRMGGSSDCYECGGSYQVGGEVFMSDSEIQQYLDAGGELDFLD